MNSRLKKGLLPVGLLSLLVACGEPEPPSITQQVISPEAVAEKYERQQSVEAQLPVQKGKQILFGDLHVHSSLSPDAFITSLPLMHGDGLHPPADACDFARYCSALDFWSINDHAEGITPDRWQQTKDSIRACNAVAGDTDNPDTVAFLGWEWSQVDHYNKDNHYGHKNVVFLDTEENKVPKRSIAAPREQLGRSPIPESAQYVLAAMDFKNRNLYLSVDDYYRAIEETPLCEKGIDTRDLPLDCLETADDPQELFKKLNEWGFDSIVIPHGNAWGLNTPAGTTFDKQLNRQQHDPNIQTLFEVYSGHGNSEEYRDWRSIAYDDQGKAYCPASSDLYQPCCQRAGEIIADRCLAAGESSQECELRAADARQNYIEAGVSSHLTVPGASTEDWLNCGQCTDCFNPGMDHRPGATAQYALAITNFDDPKNPLRFEFGFIGSSDNHRGRGGTGYKEFARHAMTESNGAKSERLGKGKVGDTREPVPYSLSYEEAGNVNLNKRRNMERQSSFFLTGGLVAVHSEGRGREPIWDALKSRQVYGTSGDRILLWFDMMEDNKVIPMGSIVESQKNPTFRVSAAGAFNQKPGCPTEVTKALSPERLEGLCRGECYNPSETRKLITRFEIVRIRPQQTPDENVADLIEDPWKVIECKPDAQGCSAEFEDPEFSAGKREVRYYARAIQEPSDAVNGGGLRCEYDDKGVCIAVDPCYGDYRTASEDNCLAPNEERAWSSPIYVKYKQ